MQPSQNAYNLVKASEGLRLTAYQDSAGILTIGWGSTMGVTPGMQITEDQAEARLERDMANAAAAVNRLVTVPLNQNQFDALVDFVFNLGQGALAGSTLLRMLNGGGYMAAAGQFDRWVHAGDRVLPGLVKRRAAERQLFETAA